MFRERRDVSRIRRGTELTPKELEVLEGWERGESLKESATRLNKSLHTVKIQRNAVRWKIRHQATQRDFTPIETAFLCWVRLHVTGARYEDVQLGNRLIAQAELVARTKTLSKAE